MSPDLKPSLIQKQVDPLLSLIRQEVGREAKDRRLRLSMFYEHQRSVGQGWHDPDLVGWRDALFERGLAPASVLAYLSTVRGAYQEIIHSNATRDLLYSIIPSGRSPERKKALVDEILTRLENATGSHAAPVKVAVRQDIADSQHLRLNREQVTELLNQPDVTTLLGIRDAAVIAILLCTGIREDELCHLDIDDIRQHLGGQPALHVRYGKGRKERLIPYGALSFCVNLTEAWIKRAGLTGGALFRGIYKGGKRARRTAIDPRSIQRILARYPVWINDSFQFVKPHDCRRTYARLLYDNEMELVAIQQNLGHSDTRTTLRYIGALDSDKRNARNIFDYDLSKLDF